MKVKAIDKNRLVIQHAVVAVHRKDPRRDVTSATTANRGRTENKRGGHRDKRKQDARSRHTSLITLTLTVGRMERRGGGGGAECCKTKPYWKSSLVL